MAAMYFHPDLSPVTALHLAALRAAGGPLAACSLRVRLGESLQRLIPAGEFDAPRGALSGEGPWRLTPEGAARIIADNASRSTDILIDFEHQALLTEQNGKPVPASGWIDPRSLVFRAEGPEPGLYGAVRWTAPAVEMIERDQYRYLSPVFPYDAATGEVLGLVHVALTNTPGIDEPIRAALSARRHVSIPGGSAPETTQETPEVNELLKKMLAALGLPETTSEADAVAALSALKTTADASTAQIAALKSAAPDLSKYVPKEVFDETRAQLAALKAGADTAEVDRLIEEGLADGRIAGQATADYLRAQGLAALKSHLADAPNIAALKGIQTKGKAPEGEDKDKDDLTAAELAVCKASGLTPEQYKAARA